MKKKEKTRLGWHVLPESGEIGIGWNGDRRKPRVGQWLRYRGANNQPTTRPPRVCCRGMHAWMRLLRALLMASNQVVYSGNSWNHSADGKCWLCRVAVKSSIDLDTAADKFAGEERKILWKILITKKEIKSCLRHWRHGDTKKMYAEVRKLKRKQGK